MLGALLGFAAPFLPDVLKMVKGRIDHKQEMQMMKLRFENASAEHEWRMKEVEIQADMADLKSARKPQESYGVQLLNAAAKQRPGDTVIASKSFNIAFLLFSAIDAFSAAVRPIITYWIVGLWGAIKLAILYSLYDSTGSSVVEAVSKVLTSEGAWTPFDEDVLAVVIGFWFGWRTRQRSAGGR